MYILSLEETVTRAHYHNQDQCALSA
jgi:hypothetical protein